MNDISLGELLTMLAPLVGGLLIILSPIFYMIYRRRKGNPIGATLVKQAPPVRKKPGYSKDFKIGLAAIPVVLILGMLFEGDSSGDHSSRNWDRNVEAMTVGQDAIRQQLKFPFTAKFSEHKYGNISGDEYYYSALVRAENSFGQKTLSSWQVILAFHSGSSNVSHIVQVVQTQ